MPMTQITTRTTFKKESLILSTVIIYSFDQPKPNNVLV